jgi:acylphosphatase
MPTLRLIIKGKVQGVFFRASAKEAANKIGVTGWVRNTPEGYVETMVNGTEAEVQQFVNWCRKGPSKAKVTEVEVSTEREQTFGDFDIVR